MAAYSGRTPVKVTTKCEPVSAGKETGTVVTAPGTVPSAIGGSVTRAHLGARGDRHGRRDRVAAVGDHLQVERRSASAAWPGRRSGWSRPAPFVPRPGCQAVAGLPSTVADAVACRSPGQPARGVGVAARVLDGVGGRGPTSRSISSSGISADRLALPDSVKVRAVGRVNWREIVVSGSLARRVLRGALAGHHDGEAVGGRRRPERW